MHKTKHNLIWLILLSLFIFHGVLEDVIYPLNYFDEIIALLCFPLAVYDHMKKKKTIEGKSTKTKKAELGLLLSFLLCGLVGNIIYRFQPLWVVEAFIGSQGCFSHLNFLKVL